MTTATRVTIEPVAAASPDALEALRDGLAAAAHLLDSPQWDDAYAALRGDEIEPQAVAAFECVTAAAVDEVLPVVARLLTAALNRRLPWSWPE